MHVGFDTVPNCGRDGHKNSLKLFCVSKVAEELGKLGCTAIHSTQRYEEEPYGQ
jgi:hypothetical protein